MEDYNFYRDNVAFLYRHFGRFKSNARFFMSPVPFEVKYEFFQGKGDKNFRTRCEALNAAVLQSEEALEEMKKRKGRSDFTPASLQELVEFVKEKAND